MKVGIITQARMTSTRLPGKVMMKVKGKTMLAYHLERLIWSDLPIYVATTTNAADDIIVEECKWLNIPTYRGSEHDVLSRYYECAVENKLDIVIRVTSDCPLIDGYMIAEGYKLYSSLNDKDLLLSNCLDRTYPIGLDYEMFSFELLKDAHENAVLNYDREHVIPYIEQNKSGKVSFYSVTFEKDYSKYRITLDTQEDFDLIKTLIEDFDADILNGEQLIQMCKEHPNIMFIE